MWKLVPVALAVWAAVSLSACVDRNDPLRGYVERSVQLEIGGGGPVAELAFASPDGTDALSTIRARVFGLDSWDAVEAITLGVHANDAFDVSLDHPALRPPGMGFLFDGLTARSRTLLFLRARGFALAPDQDFLRAASGIHPGQPIDLVVQVHPAPPNSGDETLSVVGSELDLPALRVSEQ